jgi:NADP-dependent aldehyde dehydrogenase
VDPRSSLAFTTVAPRTGEAIATYQDASSHEVDVAVAAACAAAPELRRLPPGELAAALERLAEVLDRHTEDLVDRADAETGLGRARLTGEVGRTTGQLRAFAAVLRDGAHLGVVIDPARQEPARADLRRMLVPVGPVGVFGASNFPFAFGVAGGDTAAALAAGCPVVAKAHPSNAGTSELVSELLLEAIADGGLPTGTYTLLQGAGTEVGRALVTHPDLRAVGFTGSLGGGRALFDLAAARPSPIPVYAEMGSINPLWILPSALERRGTAIAEGLAASVTLGSGQFCTKPGVAFVPDDASSRPAADRLVEAVTTALATVELGPLLDTRIRDAFADRAEQLGQLAGVEERTEPTTPPGGGWWTAPRLFVCDLDTWLRHPTLREECFGPAVVLVRTPTERLTEAASTFDGALTASLHSEPEDAELARELSERLVERVGRVVHDGYPTGVAVTWAMHHGGPYPATTSAHHTSVGASAIERFLRPVTFQDAPPELLHPAVRDDNPWRLPRRIDGRLELP